MKKLMALLLTVAMLCTMCVVPYAEEATTTVETKYTVEKMLVDLEFNGTAAETEFAGLEGLDVLPSLSDGSAVIAAGSGFCFSEASGVANVVKTALTNGKVAFEFKMKVTNGASFLLAEPMLSYNSGAIGFMASSNSVTVNADEWVTIEAILDYSGGNSVLHALNINNIAVSANVSISVDELINLGLGTYLNSDEGTAYLDYFRIYSTTGGEEGGDTPTTPSTPTTPEIDTDFTVDELLVDYEFNGTDAATEFDGLKSRDQLPALETVDGNGVAAFTYGDYDKNNIGFAFNNGSETLAKVGEAMDTSKIAFEYRMKAQANSYIVLANKLVIYSNGQIQVNGNNVVAAANGSWVKVSAVVDYTSGTGKVVKFLVNDTEYDCSAKTLPAKADLTNSTGTGMWTYMYRPYNSESSEVFLDYFRIYSVKENKETDITTKYAVNEWLYDFEFNEFDKVPGTANGVKPYIANVQGESAAVYEGTSGNVGFTLSTTDEAGLKHIAALKEGKVAYEVRFYNDGNTDGNGIFRGYLDPLFNSYYGGKAYFSQYNNDFGLLSDGWHTMTAVIDYTAADGSVTVHEVTLDDVVKNIKVTTHVATIDKLSMKSWTYAKEGAKTYLDYMRIYSVKEDVVTPDPEPEEPEEPEIDTEFTVDEMLVDYEFNGTDSATEFEGLKSRDKMPTLTTIDNNGVAQFDAALGGNVGFAFAGSSEDLSAVNAAMSKGKVAFEYRIKTTNSMYFSMANKLLIYTQEGNIQYGGRNVVNVGTGDWVEIVIVMDYSSGTGEVSKLIINGTTYDNITGTTPEQSTVINSAEVNKGLWTYLLTGRSAGAIAYLDYMRIYSVKECNETNITTKYTVNEWLYDVEFNEFDKIPGTAVTTLPTVEVSEGKSYAKFYNASGSVGFKLANDDAKTNYLNALKTGKVAIETRVYLDGNATRSGYFFILDPLFRITNQGAVYVSGYGQWTVKLTMNAWHDITAVIDYSGETFEFCKLVIDDTDYTAKIINTSELEKVDLSKMDSLSSINHNQAQEAFSYMDYLRIYSVKDKIVEPSTFDTTYTPLKTIIDYDFTDTIAPFNGLIQHYADHPFVNYKVEDGYGVAEFVTPELLTAGFKFSTSDARLATIAEEMNSNYIAYEYRMKATEGMHFVCVNKMLQYNNGYFSINEGRIPGAYVAPGEWFRATILLDYTDETPEIVEVKINDDVYDVSKTHTAPSKESLLTKDPSRMYTNLNAVENGELKIRSQVGSIAYLDYMRVYSVFKQEKVEVEEPTYINTQYEVKDWLYDYEFDKKDPYKGLNGKYDHTRWVSETVDGNDIVTYIMQNGDSGNYGFTFDKTKRDALCDALSSDEVVFEARMQSTGTKTNLRLFADPDISTGVILFGSYDDNYDQVQIYGRRVKSNIKRGDWVKVAVVVNFTGDTPKVTAVTINDEAINLTDVNKNGNFITIDTLRNTKDLLWSFAHTPKMEVGSSVSLDYLRVYTIESGSSSAILRRIDASKRSELAAVDYYDANWVLNEDGSFADLTYTLAEGVNADSDEAREVYADRAEHLLRLRGMAAEFGNKGRENYLAADLYAKVQSALSYFVNSKFDSVGTTGNWSTGITTPRQLADVFILIRNTGLEIDETLLAAAKTNYFDLSETNVSDSKYSGVQNSKKFAYNTSNLPVTCGMWMTLANIYDSSAEGDQVYIDKIYNNLGSVLTNHTDSKGNGIAGVDTIVDPDKETSVVTDTFFGDGYYPDGSYLGHGPLHYAFGYGRQFLASCSEFVTLAAGTDKQFTKAQLSVLTGIILDNMRWLVRGNYAEFTGVGRSIDTSANAGAGKRADLIKFANKLLTEPNIPSKSELTALVNDINAEAMNYVTGNKHFWNADLMAHQRDAYSVAVNMSSTRTKKTERVGDQGAKTYYLADGVTNILVDGDEYATALAYYDWDRLPGITAINSDTLPELPDNSHISNKHYGSDDFVGGVSDGTYGTATMDYKTDLGCDGVVEAPVVSAKKSWFFFDDEFVALGTDISSTEANNPLYTNLNQANLDGDVVYDGKTLSAESDAEVSAWAYHNKIGYVLPEVQSAFVSNKAQSNGTDSKGIFSMYVNHGTSVSDATYSYIVVPGKTQDEVASYAAAIPVEILANTADVQAVYHSSLGITQAVIRNKDAELTLKNGSKVSVSEPSILIIKETEGGYVITTQNPYNNTTVRNVEINERFDTFINTYNEETGISSVAVRPSNGLYAGRSVAKKLSKVYFTDEDGNKVTELTAGAKIYVNAEKEFIGNGTAEIVAAIYDKDGMLKDTVTFAYDYAADNNTTASNELTLGENVLSTDAIKVFVWADASALTPVTKAQYMK